MRDTGFVLEEQQVARFAANYERQGDGSLKLIDDPEQSSYRKRSFFSGGGGLLSTAPDYFGSRRCSRTWASSTGFASSGARPWS